MNYRIVADSAADLVYYKDADFRYVSLRIQNNDIEYVDDENLDVPKMIKAIETAKTVTRTACPGVGEWIDAFEGADVIFCVTITSGLSGSYNSAKVAANQFMEENPGKLVYVVDSLSTGPEMTMIVYKLAELFKTDMEPAQIYQAIKNYQIKTHLIFSLASLNNLANNGRVSHLVAKAAGVLNIHVLGEASEAGTLAPLSKCRGVRKLADSLIALMEKKGYKDGLVVIGHVLNWEMADELKEKIKQKFGNVKVVINETRGLCSYYAERGSLLIGFEA